MKKIFFSAILLLILCPRSLAYEDVGTGDWYYPYITELTELGLVCGSGEDYFQPNDPVTLAEFSTMLTQSYYGNSLEILSETQFTQWWEPYVYSCYLRDGLRYTTIDVEIQEFFDNGYLFSRWDDYVDLGLTRNDMAVMLSNVLTDQHFLSINHELTIQILGNFSDVDVDSPYAQYIATTVSEGLLSGYADGTFRGEDILSRGESTAILHALIHHNSLKQESYALAEQTLASPEYQVSSYDYTGNLAIENYVFARVNQLREAVGVDPVVHNDTLVEYAYIRGEETSQLFSHTRPDGSSWYTVFPETDTENRASGENLTMGYGFQSYEFPDMIFKAWLNSSGHYTNMINPNHTDLGIGVFIDHRGAFYAVQIFGK